MTMIELIDMMVEHAKDADWSCVTEAFHVMKFHMYDIDKTDNLKTEAMTIVTF